MSKPSRHRGTQRQPRNRRKPGHDVQPSKPTGDKKLRLGVTVAALVLAITGLAVMTINPGMQQSHRNGAEPSPVQPAALVTGPTTFDELTALPEDELDDLDLARMNLLTAEGLPGAEEVDLAKAEAELDRWAKYVKHETDRHLYQFHADPADFENSEAYFRVLMLITVLQKDLGVHYNPERINEPDFTNSKDLFIHGMIGDDNGGTCVSMPALTVAVGRRLGYPLKLVVTKGHVFARWDAPDHPMPNFRDRFNVECASRGLHTYEDEYYANWPYKLSDAEKNNDWFLRTLTPAEELAVFLMNRGYCLEDTGRIEEAKTAYRLASQLAPKSQAGALLAALSRPDSGLADDLDALAEASARRSARQRDIDRILERQRQRMRDLGPKIPGGPSSPPQPPIPGNPGIPGLPGGGN